MSDENDAPEQVGTSGNQTTEAPPEPQSSPAPDFNEFKERVDQRFDELRDELQTSRDPEPQPQEPQGQEGYADDDYDPGFEQEYVDQYGQPVDQYGNPLDQPPEPQVDPQAFNELLNERVQEAVQPFYHQQQEQQRMQEAEALQSRYPELASDEVADRVLDAAEQAASKLNQPELAQSPAFIEQVYLAQKGQERAQGENPAQDSRVSLEQGGAATPQEETDEGDAIVAASRRNSTPAWMR